MAVREADALPDTMGGTYNLACYASFVGRIAEAIAFLNRSLRAGLAFAKLETDPDLRALHGLPEFDAIVAEVKKRIE